MMTSANISYTRNHLSEMLARVKGGETILIVDRQQPVARLEPISGPTTHEQPWQADLVRRGLVRRARGHLDVKTFGALPLPAPREDCDILDALLTDREEGR
jgi:antitoxin (DNA-binding transcriptional repressor) of toxin-antitoxin stability system